MPTYNHDIRLLRPHLRHPHAPQLTLHTLVSTRPARLVPATPPTTLSTTLTTLRPQPEKTVPTPRPRIKPPVTQPKSPDTLVRRRTRPYTVPLFTTKDQSSAAPPKSFSPRLASRANPKPDSPGRDRHKADVRRPQTHTQTPHDRGPASHTQNRTEQALARTALEGSDVVQNGWLARGAVRCCASLGARCAVRS